jgi:hypothetical protein
MSILSDKSPSPYFNLILAFSLMANAILGGIEVRSHRQASKLDASTRVSDPTIGTKLKSLPVFSLTGNSISLPIAGGTLPTVVYVFSPACGWCRANAANISRLATAKTKEFNFVAISLTADGVMQYEHKYPLPFSSFVVNSDQLPKGFNLLLTPQTLVFSADGTLEKVFDGAYNGRDAKALQDFFGLGFS